MTSRDADRAGAVFIAFIGVCLIVVTLAFPVRFGDLWAAFFIDGALCIATGAAEYDGKTRLALVIGVIAVLLFVGSFAVSLFGPPIR